MDVKEDVISKIVSLFIIVIIYIYQLDTGRLEGVYTEAKPAEIAFDAP